jgi:hypothetical protein
MLISEGTYTFMHVAVQAPQISFATPLIGAVRPLHGNSSILYFRTLGSHPVRSPELYSGPEGSVYSRFVVRVAEGCFDGPHV